MQCICACLGGDGIGGLGWVQRRRKASITSRLPSVRSLRHSSTDQKTLGLPFMSLIAVKHSERSTKDNESTCSRIKRKKKNIVFFIAVR